MWEGYPDITTRRLFIMKRGKKYVEAAKAIDRGTLYDVADAVALVKKTAVAKFDETIEAHIRTGCDGRHADQQIRGAVVATPDMMGVVGRLGRVLGPKGLMPNPKAGTVTMDVTKAIQDIKAGKIEYRLDKTNIIHVPVGKASFTEEQLADNFQTLIDAINKAKPAALKGQYLKTVTLTSTMGPGVKINPMKLA